MVGYPDVFASHFLIYNFPELGSFKDILDISGVQMFDKVNNLQSNSSN